MKPNISLIEYRDISLKLKMAIWRKNHMLIWERNSYLEMSLETNHVLSFLSLIYFLLDAEILQIHLPKVKQMRQPSGINFNLVGYLTIQW